MTENSQVISQNRKPFTVEDLAVLEKLPELLCQVKWKPKEVVLDYNCNYGAISNDFILPQVRKHQGKLWSVDSRGARISRAKKDYPEVAEIFIEGEILTDKEKDNWPLKNIKFDKVFAIQVLHHLQEPIHFLRKIHEQLNFGGQFIAMVPLDLKFFLGIREGLIRFGGYWKELIDGYPTFADWATGIEASSYVQRQVYEAGFSIVHFDVVEYSCQYEDSEVLADYTISLLAYAVRKNLDKYVQKNLRKALTEEIPKILGISKETKPINHSGHKLLLVAKKRGR